MSIMKKNSFTFIYKKPENPKQTQEEVIEELVQKAIKKAIAN